MKSIQKLKLLKYILLTVVLFMMTVNSFAQTKNKKLVYKQQSVFSSEEKVRNQTKIPHNILQQLKKYNDSQLENCQKDKDFRQSNISKHFAASKINFNRFTGFVIQAQTPCFMGAHNTTFWIFQPIQKDKYKLLFDISADSLTLLKTQTKGYRDVETSSLTVNEVSTIKWKFNGKIYQPKECWREGDSTNGKQKVSCH